jgi:hypothetical protein
MTHQTQLLLEQHVLRPIASIIHSYIIPLTDDDYAIAQTGHGELCLGIIQFQLGLEGACQGGYHELVNLMIARGANNWNRGLYSACKVATYIFATHYAI